MCTLPSYSHWAFPWGPCVNYLHLHLHLHVSPLFGPWEPEVL